MSDYTLYVAYDAGIARPCTWRLGDEHDTIRVRVKVGQGNEVVLSLRLRCNRSKRHAPDAFHLRRVNEDAWAVEGAKYHRDLPRLDLILRGAPPHVAAVLGSL